MSERVYLKQVRRHDVALQELKDERDLLREQLSRMDGIVRLQERRCRVMEDEIHDLQEELRQSEQNLARCQDQLESATSRNFSADWEVRFLEVCSPIFNCT